MKVKILDDVCQGHGMCRLACGEIFGINGDDGHAIILIDEIPEMLESIVVKAVSSCPEEAIVIYD